MECWKVSKIPTPMILSISRDGTNTDFGSFQSQNRANQGSIFLHLHLWMHTILASRYLTDHSSGRREARKPVTNGNGNGNGSGNGSGNGTNGTATGLASGQATPHTMTVNNMWRNSARTIGDILVLTDIINPFTYVALPFVNQAFYVAGSCYVKGKSRVPSSVTACPVRDLMQVSLY